MGFFCCQANPQPRGYTLLKIKQQPQDDCYRLHLLFSIQNLKALAKRSGGIIPSKNYPFIKHVDPISPP